MKILVLMKRFGAGKDMVMQDFGRQIRLFGNIAKKHNVDFFVPDYKKLERKDIRLHGMNFCIRPYSLLRHFSFISELKKSIKKNKYDVIVGTADPLLGILAYKLGRKYGIKSVYDMQDEYSVYSSYRIPFVQFLDKKSVIGSDVVLTVSDSLNRLVRQSRKKKTVTIQNGVDANAYKKYSKSAARKKLGLPNKKIIVYVGEISRFKGVDILVESFKEVQKLVPDSCLLLSGPVVDVDIKSRNVIYEKYPEKWQVIAALSASDIAVLPNPKNRFSEYCFPYKLAEYMASGISIVATNMGDAGLLLKESSLCEPGDKFAMAAKIVENLVHPTNNDYRGILKSLSWKSLSAKVESSL